jgi:hypothetical protein
MKYLSLTMCLILAACGGYRWGREGFAQHYKTICVPYAEGDEVGLFTEALIRAVTTRSMLAYTACGADLQLKVCLLSPEDINIGFIYAPREHDDDRPSKVISANEARLTQRVQITLIDNRSGSSILGPLEIATSLTYDFESDLSHDNENNFSLGQFEMHNIAQTAAFPPLYTLLAEKIVDYVNNSW